MKVKYDMMLVRRMKMYKNGACEKEIEILRKNNGKQKMLDRVNEKLKAVVISIRGVKENEERDLQKTIERERRSNRKNNQGRETARISRERENNKCQVEWEKENKMAREKAPKRETEQKKKDQ